MASRLPAFALFPLASWRDQLLADEWATLLDAWVALINSHLSLSDADFISVSAKDESLSTFLISFTRETAQNGVGILGTSSSAKRLLRDCYQLITKLLQSSSPPSSLAQWDFLSDVSTVYGKKKTSILLDVLSESSRSYLETSLAGLKKFLVKNLDAGLSGGDLNGIQSRLEQVNNLIHASPFVAEYFLAGSDFIDGLISCYKITNPPLRRSLISTLYVCLIGLADSQKIGPLTDHLYSLKAAADTHKTGPLNVNDSLVAELVTSTPLLQQLQRKLDVSTSTRTTSVISSLAAFKKPTSSTLFPAKPKRLIRRKIDKGKGLVSFDQAAENQEIHVHRLSSISQVQDLFPELGSGFISKLLDEYHDSTEDVIAHLLDDSLPPHLSSLDRSEDLAPVKPPIRRHSSLVPRPTPPHLSPILPPTDNDDDLALLTGNLHLGKKPGNADALLRDKSTAPAKAAILSALAAFDSDDDERDDTYDAADVGGTVDTSLGDEILPDGAEALLYRSYQAEPALFSRDSKSRSGPDRLKLKQETGMTDEQIEGWAVMLQRDANLQKRLQRRYGEWTGEQTQLERTGWVAGDEDTDGDGSGPSRGGFRGGRGRGGGNKGRGGRSGGRGGGQQGDSGPQDDAARRRKEANKGSRANHNRRDQRAKKMARGGFAG
ncbi:hypothetical protein QBC40DRAFT_272514 [Triangularia verruculosa]|uniref:CUE domain-containing protein n=1 Tax=Triangularia verruculosa TaxID=2587418 RepID=A0AAN7AZS1_9PEZI|nr:hypothetical protein QBC40DRAFT_272514 [Triangularia verruculosa]